MAKKISEIEAKKIFLSHGLQLKGKYQGSKKRVKCIHLQCGEICYPMLEKVKLGQIGCKPCRYKKVANSLKLSEEAATKIMQTAGYIPLEPYVNALTKWKCKHLQCGGIVHPLLNQIQQGQGGCFKCGHISTGLKKRTPQDKINEVLARKNFTLIGKYTGANNKLTVKCNVCSNEIEAIFAVISRKAGRGCKPCAIKQSAERYRLNLNLVRKRLKKANMRLVGEYKNSNTPVECKCLKCGVVRSIRISILLNGSGCHPCSLIKSGIKRRTNELVALEIMRNIGKVEPIEPYTTQNTRWKSRCKTCGAIVFPRLGTIKSRGGIGCDPCSIQIRGVSRRIPQTKAYSFLIENGFIPLDSQKYIDTNTDINCTHSCGNVVTVSYRRVLTNVNLNLGSCRPCGHKKYADTTRFDISIIDNIYKKQKLKLQTRTYMGMRYKHPTICLSCGHEWETIPSRIALGTGCPNCSLGGFKPGDPAYFYLIVHDQFNAYKVGIANISKTKLADRFYHHQKQGWELLGRWDFNHGKNAQNLEKIILHELRKEMDIPPYLAKEDMPFGGWTETFSADSISTTKLKKLIELNLAASL